MRMIILLVTMLTVFVSCKKYDQPSKAEYSTNEKVNNSGGSEASGHIKIAIVSDIHYMHPSLLHENAQNGEPFKSLASMHRPMAEYSVPIFDEVLSQLLQEHPDIVLIPGNLALDGEKISHQAVADNLQQLLAAGIKVYVTPGRHDINNPKAVEY